MELGWIRVKLVVRLLNIRKKYFLKISTKDEKFLLFNHYYFMVGQYENGMLFLLDDKVEWYVVYFDQLLGAMHSNTGQNLIFSHIFERCGCKMTKKLGTNEHFLPYSQMMVNTKIMH